MRLNKTIRQEIVQTALIKAFSKRKEELKQNLIKFADELYDFTYGETVSKFKNAPPEWLYYNNTARIDAPGFSYKTTEKTLNYDLYLTVPKAFPIHFDYGNKIKLTPEHPLFDKSQELVHTHMDLWAEEEALEAKLNSIVNSVSTLKQLLEIWPECANILPKDISPAPLAIVPISLINDVNKALGMAKPIK
ncbi:Uncharacterised protein [Oligella urethralis]|uniref:Nmad5 family putative nucleotide modification protein n=1 Tax=Oligella urethralis TaxID=90245 RepID=UPI000E036935|nr:Nmad5 family putative nucleotide modification protein [Oligella urethralis]SUA63435.1 Uncharacterised protein [Oligella urethralis]